MIEIKQSRKIKLKYLFYGEAGINLGTLIICLFFPAFFLKQLVGNNPTEIISIEIVRWYGILLFVITFILVGSIILEKFEFVKIVIIGYLIGDVAQIIASIILAVRISYWSFAIIFTISITVLLIVLRILGLIKPKLLGFKEEKIEN